MPQIYCFFIILSLPLVSISQSDSIENNKIIANFYTSFKNKDAKEMASNYHDSIVFYDPAFGYLRGSRAKAMWAMICENGDDLLVEFSNIKSDIETGEAHWEADYTFTATNNKIHNIIDAQFIFKDGKIISHTDLFDFKKWSKQAFGFLGKTIGQTKFFHKQFTKKANKILDEYITLQNGK